jgi:hypothetical protein
MAAGAIALAAIPIITSLIQGAGQMSEAKSQSAYARYNAQVAEDQARMVAQARDFEIAMINRRKQKMLSRQTALFAKAGVRFSGTVIETIAGTATEYALDIASERYNSAVQIAALPSAAYLMRRTASDLTQGGRYSALMTVGSGVANAAMSYGFSSLNKPATTTPKVK